MNFCKRNYQPILRYLYAEVTKRRGEISLHKHFKEKWQQKFLYLFYFGRYSHLNQRTLRHLRLIFDPINYVLVKSQEG